MDNALGAITQTFPGAITAINIVVLLSAIFFFTSTIASHALEYFVGWKNSRGNQLKARLEVALGDDFEAEFRKTPLIQSLMTKKSTITGKSKENTPSQYPSYIPAETFATAALSVYEESKIQASGTNKIQESNGYKLITILSNNKNAGGDLQKKLSDWYNDINERQNGSYTRWSMFRLILIGLAISLFLDIDVFHLVTSSLNQPKNLDKIVTEINKQFPTLSASQGKNLSDEDKGKLVDYVGKNWSSAFEPAGEKNLYAWQALPKHTLDWIAKIFGWILTALATSLGAQFWFNTLSDALKLRAAGPKPDDKPEKGSKRAAATG